MKKLDFPKTGGEWFTQDDLMWGLNGLQEAIAQSIQYAGNTNYIITGVRDVLISGSTYGNSAGVVIINGEVGIVAADTTVGIDVIALPERYLVPVDSYDPTGFVPFQTGPSQNIYKVTVYEIQGFATVQPGLVSRKISYYEDIIKGMIFSRDATALTISVGTLALPSFSNIFTVDIAPTDTLNYITGDNLTYQQGATAPIALWLQFIGASATDTVTIQGGVDILTPGGADYVFSSGDWAMFLFNPGTAQYELITKSQSGWTDVSSFGTGWGSGSTPSPATPLRYMKDSAGNVVINGTALYSLFTSGTNTVIFTLPVGYRPSKAIYKIVYDYNSATPYAVCVDISGDVILSQAGLTGINMFTMLDINFSSL